MVKTMQENAKIVLADQNHCTGCGACANICPKAAIQMLPDEEGFIQPVIDDALCVKCKLCEKTCPVLHPSYQNKKVDTCYAMWAEDDLRAVTSTAGLFLLLAKHIIAQNGVVYGAAWTEDWYVHHIGVETEDDLKLLTGSKYLQSNVENTYQETKENLSKGRKVLYSGCPCQIAGLYAYLGDQHLDNLLTFEIICHGVPSPKAFHKYLNDNFDITQINKIDFRDKTVFGWSTTSNIYFNNNSVYRKREKADPYYRAFLPCLILRRSCSVCPFSKLPRQADLSGGDFWGIDRVDRTWDDRKGTGLVLVNNTKGEIYFNTLKQQFQRVQRFPLEAATRINKTIIHPFKMNPGRKHFFSSMDLMPFSQAVDNSLSHSYDIGVVGFWYGINYGSVLTYFALYQLLRDLGYDPVMIPKPPQLWDERFNDLGSIAQKFILSHCNVFNPMKYIGEVNRMNDRCKDFIVGSDVVWNYDIAGKEVGQFFVLDWVEKGHKKIAFSSSFGNTLGGSEQYQKNLIANLKSFDGVSIREDTGAKILSDKTGRLDIAHTLDPVFLCDIKIYDTIIQSQDQNIIGSDVFAYFLNGSGLNVKKNILEYYKQAKGYSYEICGNPNSYMISKKRFENKILPVISVENWIFRLKECKMFIGDSYHGLCFSLIFHKPFVIIYTASGNSSSYQRFESLLKICNLSNRIIDKNECTTQTFEDLFNQQIDWDDVEQRLEPLRKQSIDWLKNVLSKEESSLSPDDFLHNQLMRLVAEQGIKMQVMEKEINELKANSVKMSKRKNVVSKLISSIKNDGIVFTMNKIMKFIHGKFM